MKIQYIIIAFLGLGFIISCTKDKIDNEPAECNEEVTYVKDIKPIIDNTCTFSDCHVSGNNVPGSFTSYDGLQGFLSESLFERRVLVTRDMPPNYSSGPKFLTEQEINLISCWVEQGYLEN